MTASLNFFLIILLMIFWLSFCLGGRYLKKSCSDFSPFKISISTFFSVSDNYILLLCNSIRSGMESESIMQVELALKLTSWHMSLLKEL